MRILYFYQYFTTPKGSWSTRAYEMARRWVERGEEVTILTTVYDKSDLRPMKLIDHFIVDGINVVVLNVEMSNKHGVLKRAYTFIAYALLASWYVLRSPFDVAVASSGPITVGIPGLVARYLKRKPFVFEIRDLWADSLAQMSVVSRPWLIRMAYSFERLCYRAADHVIACSPGQADGVHAIEKGVPVTVVSNAADLELNEIVAPRASLPDWADDPYVVYAGTIGPANDCMQLVRVAEALRESGRDDINVVLIGDGAERQAIEAYLGDHDIKNVRLLNLMPKNQVVTWLHHATASIISLRGIPVFDTVSPNKLFDSFSVGAPVLQSTQGWIKTLLAEERCGLTVSPGDARAMARAICELVDNPSLRREMSRNGRRVAEEQFDRNLLAERMRGILRGVAGAEVEVEPEDVPTACAA